MTWDDVHSRLTRLREHDPAAWDELSALVYPLLLATAAQTAGNGWSDASSSDLAQEAWMKLRQGFGNFRGADAPADTTACLRAWLRTVVKNVIHSHTRRHTGPRVLPLAPAPGVLTDHAAGDRQRRDGGPAAEADRGAVAGAARRADGHPLRRAGRGAWDT